MKVEIEHRMASHCENGVTGALLRFHGLDYSEPMIFGLSASLFFVHLPMVKLTGFPVTSFRPLPGAIFSRVTKMLGVKTHSQIFLRKEKAMQKLDGLLVRGMPAGVVVSMYFLPYMPPEYRFHFNAHNLCVFGKEGEEYLVGDPLALKPVRLASDDLLRARFARGTHPPMGKLYWIESVPHEMPALDSLVRKAVLKNCWRMVHEPGPVPLVGVNGIFYLAKRIPDFPKKYGTRKAALHLAFLIRMMEEIGTGGAGFRFLYAAFLQEAVETTGIQELDGFSERLTAIGDAWRNFASSAARVYKGRSGEAIDYVMLGGLMKEIAEQEKNFFIDLEKMMKEQKI